ncbi:hypothetical protein X925_09745 [Petrotoga sp. 9T1HF07.CasAA.8.2]|nr:hypothetical protein X925_09745 [Petrotoga sp. 9T1HF07.CasAA.8.2]PNR93874.1 hypothetical protein X926_02510 [Petrotoga sp. HWHPT.55.6.3]
MKGQSSIGFIGGRWVANKLLNELKREEKGKEIIQDIEGTSISKRVL